MNSTKSSFQKSSLYVGDLHPDIDEAALFEKFSGAGPILSIRVCRDAETRRSLGYAYVNFQLPADAERALDTMDFEIRGQPFRMMWSQRDPAMRRSGVGNVFLKDLHTDIDTRAIYDTFADFGEIVSCKVATDENGISKGYGFIHFETEEAANSAIEKVNGKLLNGKKVYVGKFIPRQKRQNTPVEEKTLFKNVYVKNLEDDFDDDKLKTLFEPFGKITSYKVMSKEDGKSLGFGFVAYENSEAAQAAVEALHGKKIGDNNCLFVGPAKNKAERQQEVKRKLEELRKQRHEATQNLNVFVKNFGTTFDDERLRHVFSPYGTITSAKVMTDQQGRSKGHGFVCYSKPNEASCAVTELNGRIIGTKCLYVALAQRKEDRHAMLSSQFAAKYTNGGMQQQLGHILQPHDAAGFYKPNVAPMPHFVLGPHVSTRTRNIPCWVPNAQPEINFHNPGMAPIPNGGNAGIVGGQQATIAAGNMQMCGGDGHNPPSEQLQMQQKFIDMRQYQFAGAEMYLGNERRQA